MLLRCIDIEKSFGGLAVLKGVTLDIHRDEKIGLVGSNGAGKQYAGQYNIPGNRG